MATGKREKAVHKKVANRTSKATTPTTENLQRSRSKQDGPTKKKSSRGKNSGGLARNVLTGTTEAQKKKPTGRGTEISNKALEKRTKRELGEVRRARAADNAEKAAKSSAKKAAKKAVGKAVAKAIPGVGTAITILDAVTTRKKSTTGRSNAAKRKAAKNRKK